MTDLIAELDAQRNNLDDLNFGYVIVKAWPQLREMARDAERYRLLRSATPDFTVMIPRIHGHIGFSHQALDEKLDAALAKEKP